MAYAGVTDRVGATTCIKWCQKVRVLSYLRCCNLAGA